GTFPALAVDSAGHPHMVYNNVYENGLHYATYDGAKWHTQIVDGAHTDYSLGLALDRADRPHISYYLYHQPDGTYATQLKYAYFDGKEWFIQTADPRERTGKYNSIAVDSSGKPYIAYTDVKSGDLECAVRNGDSWERRTAESRRSRNAYVGLGNSVV